MNPDRLATVWLHKRRSECRRSRDDHLPERNPLRTHILTDLRDICEREQSGRSAARSCVECYNGRLSDMHRFRVSLGRPSVTLFELGKSRALLTQGLVIWVRRKTTHGLTPRARKTAKLAVPKLTSRSMFDTVGCAFAASSSSGCQCYIAGNRQPSPVGQARPPHRNGASFDSCDKIAAPRLSLIHCKTGIVVGC